MSELPQRQAYTSMQGNQPPALRPITGRLQQLLALPDSPRSPAPSLDAYVWIWIHYPRHGVLILQAWLQLTDQGWWSVYSSTSVGENAKQRQRRKTHAATDTTNAAACTQYP
ncbi:hypothetical protein DFH27DRAFT_613266 [Peziza echinospora]|nr:hypothetical protein DFH27DRAFT_618763 [Peziza echinospora]KAI5779433.1 hypothetical protein DFH27DRAFT_618749 [Peziza echinospora]KAI5793923.1 hypothetical protein DFH27DRAFT_613266 [Peziza echinospora]